MQRRSFLLSSLAIVACAKPSPVARCLSKPSDARRLAITIDDPNVSDLPLLRPVERDTAILQALSVRSKNAALFVCGMRVDSAEGASLLARWSRAGHSLCNHSYSHRYFHSAKMTVADFVTELERGDGIVRVYPGFRRRFRFPFLKEGNTREKRDAAREALVAHGYTHGHVTIDASDWAFDERLVKRLHRARAGDLSPFRAAYIEHMLSRAHYYDDLARAIVGRTIAHTLLVHHSLLNALFLSDLLAAFEKDGWSIIDAEEAYADPIFQQVPDVIPAGESLVRSLASEKPAFAQQLRYPGEDEGYEKATLDRLEPPER